MVSLLCTNISRALKLKLITNSKIAVGFNESCLKQDKATFDPKNAISLFVFRLDVW